MLSSLVLFPSPSTDEIITEGLKVIIHNQTMKQTPASSCHVATTSMFVFVQRPEFICIINKAIVVNLHVKQIPCQSGVWISKAWLPPDFQQLVDLTVPYLQILYTWCFKCQGKVTKVTNITTENKSKALLLKQTTHHYTPPLILQVRLQLQQLNFHSEHSVFYQVKEVLKQILCIVNSGLIHWDIIYINYNIKYS